MSLSDFPVGAAAAVSDMDRACRFYEDKLGLRRASDHEPADNVTYLCAGGTKFHVFLSPNAGTSKATLAGWYVDEIEEVVRDLDAKGVVFEQYDEPGLTTDEQGIAHFGPNKVAYFKDPDGNILSIAH